MLSVAPVWQAGCERVMATWLIAVLAVKALFSWNPYQVLFAV